VVSEVLQWIVRRQAEDQQDIGDVRSHHIAQ